MKTIKTFVLTGAVLLYSKNVLAGMNIGASSSPIFAKPITFLQDIVNALDGPGATAAIVCALIAALVSWNFAPGRSEWLGKSLRAVMSGIFIFGIAALISYMRS